MAPRRDTLHHRSASHHPEAAHEGELIAMTSVWWYVARSAGLVAWAVVAMYLLVAVEVSSLMRRRLPKRWWRGIHTTSYAVYAFGTIHLLTAGTDRHSALRTPHSSCGLSPA